MVQAFEFGPLDVELGIARVLGDEGHLSNAQAGSLLREVLRRSTTGRLQHLVQIFGLSPFELDALLVTLAPALDLRYERLYGYLQDDVTRKRPSVKFLTSPPATIAPPEFAAIRSKRLSTSCPWASALTVHG